MTNYRLSIFKNAFDTEGTETSLDVELSDIKKGKYKQEIDNCRKALLQEKNKDLYTKYKSKLKAVTFCGYFENGRKLSNLIHYNQLIVIDIDDLSNIDAIKAVLIKDKYVMALWDSPSALGLKGLIKVNSTIDNHKDFFLSLSIYFFQQYNIRLDKSGSDITRLCYVSFDENIYFNHTSDIFSELINIERKTFNIKKLTAGNNDSQAKINKSLQKRALLTEGLNKTGDRQQMKKIISYLSNKNLSITDSFDNWIKTAVIISNSFSFDIGENYFLTLCRMDGPKHNEERSINLLWYCYNKRNLDHPNRLTFGSLIHLASEKGFVKRKFE